MAAGVGSSAPRIQRLSDTNMHTTNGGNDAGSSGGGGGAAGDDDIPDSLSFLDDNEGQDGMAPAAIAPGAGNTSIHGSSDRDPREEPVANAAAAAPQSAATGQNGNGGAVVDSAGTGEAAGDTPVPAPAPALPHPMAPAPEQSDESPRSPRAPSPSESTPTTAGTAAPTPAPEPVAAAPGTAAAVLAVPASPALPSAPASPAPVSSSVSPAAPAAPAEAPAPAVAPPVLPTPLLAGLRFSWVTPTPIAPVLPVPEAVTGGDAGVPAPQTITMLADNERPVRATIKVVATAGAGTGAALAGMRVCHLDYFIARSSLAALPASASLRLHSLSKHVSPSSCTHYIPS